MRAILQLFTILPGVLRLAWGLLLAGMVMLAAGYFTDTPWQSYAGLGCLISGYLLAILDMIFRKRHRGAAAGFYVGATIAPVFALLFLLFAGLLAAAVLAVESMLHGYSGVHAARLLHFLGIMFAFFVVTGISGLALKAKQKDEPDPEGSEQDQGRAG